jgi:hypothetical protein
MAAAGGRVRLTSGPTGLTNRGRPSALVGGLAGAGLLRYAAGADDVVTDAEDGPGGTMSRRRAMIRLLLGATVSLGIVLVPAPAAHADYKGYAIFRGDYLDKGDYLSRPILYTNYKVQLIMQQDGNLVLKRTTGHVCWATGTNPGGYRARYQTDGNLVVYRSDGVALWASHTKDVPGVSLSIERDGDLWVGEKEIAYC